jgi:hypothetical protein
MRRSTIVMIAAGLGAGLGLFAPGPSRAASDATPLARAAGDSIAPAPPPGVTLAPAALDSGRAEAPIDSLRVPLLPDRIAVYYFHPTIRCEACRQCEAYAREALAAAFLPALRAGELEWRVFDFDEPVNQEWVERFQVDSSRLLVVEYVRGEVGRWVALDDIWYLLEDRAGYHRYVQEQVRRWLEGS